MTTMHPNKVNRHALHTFTDLPNIGPAAAADYRLLGYHSVADLVGVDAYDLYQRLCQVTGQRHDPCVIDVFLSVQHFLAGDDARPWWHYTAERKARLGAINNAADGMT